MSVHTPDAVSEKSRDSKEYKLDNEDRVALEGDVEKQSPDATALKTSTSNQDTIIVEFSGDDDPESPKSMSYARKWLITGIIGACSFCVTCNSAIYTSTYAQLEKEFGISREVATLGLSTFVVGLAIGPMFLAPLSEFYGRKPVYLSSYFLVLMFIIPCAVAQNIQTMLICRFFDGVFASSFLSVAGGTIGDIYRKEELSWPMMVYSGSPFMGPSLGPVIGGFINQYASWRWTFYVLIIWTGVQLVLISMLIPETYHPVLLRRKAQRLRKETGDERYKSRLELSKKSITRTILFSCVRPFQILALEPMVLNLCILSALLLGILYLFFGAYPLVFQNNHGFTLSQTGLTFISLMVGMVLAVFTDPFWRWNYARIRRNRSTVPGELAPAEPEDRLPPVIVGGIIFPLSIFGFGWTTYPSVPWIVPLIFSGFFGFSVVLCFSGIFTFKVESYPLYAASSLAANSFARSIFAASFPLFGVQMYQALGYQWATSLLGFLALALMPFPYIFFKYGKRIRQKSRFNDPAGK